jgi:flagellar protein FliO/FliZ
MIDVSDYLRFAFALVFVLALIGLATWLARRLGYGSQLVRARPGSRRLGVVEAATIDAKRRLVLVRRDGVEHLLLIGGGTDLVIEHAISVGEPAGTHRAEPVAEDRR